MRPRWVRRGARRASCVSAPSKDVKMSATETKIPVANSTTSSRSHGDGVVEVDKD